MCCNKNCKICPNVVISNSVTVTTVGGTDTLVIDLPTAQYNDRCRYCIVVAQAIPESATITMPVAFSIGGTTTVYPFNNCDCSQVTACGIRTRTRYPVTVVTNATGGTFLSAKELPCYPAQTLSSIPAPSTTP